MPAITFDAQSFTVDGKRVWLVGGTIEYARLPRAVWAERIAAARAAGFNCVTTCVVWARHEPRAGQFDFSGDNDLRHFVELISAAGMFCILRVGPYVGAGFDLGGIPPWLLNNPNVVLRTTNGPFLEASSRFIDAVARQVRDLQATAPEPQKSPLGGPIIAVQNENGWTCGHDQIALGYLGELNRYLRESGFDVPFVNANDLWQGIEGEIDGWTGSGAMLPHLRQLGSVRPSQPKVVMEYRIGRQATWASKPGPALTGHALQRGIAEVLAAGAQFNVEPLSGGTNFGFSAGRLADSPASYGVSSAERSAAIGEDGQLRPHYHALRRLALFASRFGRVFAHLDPKRQNVCLLPPEAAHQQAAGRPKKLAEITPGGHVVVDAMGSQGSVVFIFAPTDTDGTPDSAGHDPATLLLPDGTILPVHLGDQPVAWVVLDTRLIGRSQLDYCNLSAVAIAGRIFVCSGPAGSPARMSINGAELSAQVPTGDEPLLLEHENVIIMIVPDGLLPKVHIADTAVYMDVEGLSLEGLPVVAAWGQKFRRVQEKPEFEVITAEQHPKPATKAVEAKKTPEPPKGKKVKGKGKPVPPAPPPPPPAPLPPNAAVAPHERPPARITLSTWETHGLEDYLDGTGPRFASIAGPADLSSLGAPHGYGWYRLTLKNPRAGKAIIAMPHAGDRMALFEHGHAVALLGNGPGAGPEASIKLQKGEQTLVVLAENFGRFSEGPQVGESKGLYGHVWEVAPHRLGKPTLKRSTPMDVLGFRSPLWYVHQGDATDPHRLSWTLPARRKGPAIITLAPGRQRGLVVLNDKPIRFFDPSGPSSIFIDEATLGRGSAELQLAILGDAEEAEGELAHALSFYDCEENLTAKADWAFAKWERPASDSFAADHKRRLHVPRWWRTTFSVSTHRTNLWLDTDGLSKGQLYLNGAHVGRYFTATADGRHVGPQTDLLLPWAWLKSGEPNELLIFDEHGFAPVKVRVKASR